MFKNKSFLCQALATLTCLLFTACSSNAQIVITDFDSCVAAGNKVLRSYPARCVAQGIGTFVQSLPNEKGSSAKELAGCKNLCGDGQCAEIVCKSDGCPCAETPLTCPQDCQQDSTLNR